MFSLGNCCRYIKVSSTNMKDSKLPKMMGYYTLFKSRLNESENQDPKFEGRDIWKNGNGVYLYQDPEGFWSVSYLLPSYNILLGIYIKTTFVVMAANFIFP